MTTEAPIDNAWSQLPRYQAEQSYQWNYDHPPEPVELATPPMPGEWRLADWPLPSPLGVPAGPLLNGRWCLYYASLGFDVVTYKTVRSGARPCYPLPNVQPVDCPPLVGGEAEVAASDRMAESWAVSYGMPSMAPDTWRADVRATRAALAVEKRLVVSVVGTVQDGWSMEQLAADYAACAEAAAESGADAVECNFSCPNVSTCDGQLYQDPDSAGLVARRVRERIGQLPLFVKIGYLPEQFPLESLLEQLAPSVQAVAATNSIATRVRGADGQLLFDGQVRGICGGAILNASIHQIERMRRTIDQLGIGVQLIGVGGAATAADVQRYLDAGAANVQMATSAMLRPWTALAIRSQWSAVGSPSA